jgi:hypothetical protein
MSDQEWQRYHRLGGELEIHKSKKRIRVNGTEFAIGQTWGTARRGPKTIIGFNFSNESIYFEGGGTCSLTGYFPSYGTLHGAVESDHLTNLLNTEIY